MRRSTWMKISLPMALVAMLALFVSPVLALECCCQTAVQAPVAQVQPNPHSCCEKVPAQAEHCEEATAAAPHSGATLSKVCRCAQAQSQPFTSSTTQVFFPGAVLLASPVETFEFHAPVAWNIARYFEVHLSRPSPPDLTRASGRAPPLSL